MHLYRGHNMLFGTFLLTNSVYLSCLQSQTSIIPCYEAIQTPPTGYFELCNNASYNRPLYS